MTVAYRALEKLINLHDGYRGVFRGARGDMLLLQEQGKVRLIARLCPHQDSPLDYAPVEDGCITCPLHQLRFSLDTGQVEHGACAALAVYPIVYEGNTLGIEE